MRILVIIPAFNEEGAIARVISAIPQDLVAEIVVVDNASDDGTARAAHAAGATVLTEHCRGYGHACLCGIAYARQRRAEVVVFLDGDYSDHPEEMEALTEPIRRGEADMVIGSRTQGISEPGALLPQARVGNMVACLLMQAIWGAAYSDLGPFRAARLRDLTHLGMRDGTFGWTVEMQIKAHLAGLRVTEVPVSYRRRIGASKITGTISGTAKASAKILWTIWQLAWRTRKLKRYYRATSTT